MANNEFLDEFLDEFVIETHERLARLDSDLLALEKDPTDKSTIAQVFRALHNIKGTAGFMGLAKLEAVAHSAESLLSRLRAGDFPFNRPIATAMLRVVDAIREIITSLKSSASEGSRDYADLREEVDRLRETGGGDAAAPRVERAAGASPKAASVELAATGAGASIAAPSLATGNGDGKTVLRIDESDSAPEAAVVAPAAESFDDDASYLWDANEAAAGRWTGEPPVEPSTVPYGHCPEARELKAARAATPEGPPVAATPLPVRPAPIAPPPAVASSRPLESKKAARPAEEPKPAAERANGARPSAPTTFSPPGATERQSPRAPADTSIRVDVGLLDKLMTLVGELVLARNQILRFRDASEDAGYVGAVQRLNVLATELQAGVMKTRMQPIGNVLSKFPRVVRDLALACGKRVRFEMEGQETELDKTLLEAIRDPLTHMVRNAVDHGVEPPGVRRLSGKSEEGCLRMLAFHEGGKVIIEVSDDGGGIDVARVRDKAIAANLVAPHVIARMTPQEILRLIFLPGFSTADRVTQFSGRGVGMDVVRTNIERIGGTVDVESTLGHGTTIRTKIPLTLAIIPALIVETAGERYAIPQVSLLEVVRLDRSQVLAGVERFYGAPVYRLRGALLPLVYLDAQFELDSPGRPRDEDLNVVVLQSDDRSFGVVVDAIRDAEEVVVKPLQKQLKGINVFAGAAIMGDGRVALVLDVLGLAQRAGVVSGPRTLSLVDHGPATTAKREVAPLLLFTTAEAARMAIPLASVARLEEFPRAALETLGARLVVPYRGEILPLIDVARELAAAEGRAIPATPRDERDERGERGERGEIAVIVCQQGKRRVGLIVERILDIVHEEVVADAHAARPGVSFSAIVKERVTEFLDVAALVREATPQLSGAD